MNCTICGADCLTSRHPHGPGDRECVLAGLVARALRGCMNDAEWARWREEAEKVMEVGK